MKQINIHEAKTHLSRLADQAHEGETIIIAKGGKPWAMLMPLAKQETAGLDEPMAAIDYSGAPRSWYGESVKSKPKKRILGTLSDKNWYLASDWNDSNDTTEAIGTITPNDPLWEFAMNQKQPEYNPAQPLWNNRGAGRWKGKVVEKENCWASDPEIADLFENSVIDPTQK